MQPISQRDAKAVIRSLGTSGQPPKFGARLINVGTEQFLRHLEEEYLKDHCLPIDGRDGGGTCKWVRGRLWERKDTIPPLPPRTCLGPQLRNSVR